MYIQNRLNMCKTQFCGADFAESDLRNRIYKAKTLKTGKIVLFFLSSDDRPTHYKQPSLFLTLEPCWEHVLFMSQTCA